MGFAWCLSGDYDSVAGVEHPTGVSLWSNRRSHAARFFIDAGWCGWGSSFRVCPSVGRADASKGPSTPASSLLQKAAENTIGSHSNLELTRSHSPHHHQIDNL